MAQKTFTFNKQFSFTQKKGYVPLQHIDFKSQIRAQLNRQGYVVKDLIVEETITVSCVAARANVSPKERERLQRMTENVPTSHTKFRIAI